ncbi:MAG: calcium/proton exchanger [Nitrospirota bacterium]
MTLKPSLNWLFLFIPAAAVAEHAGTVPASAVFFSAALAIIPVARLIVLSTEQIATRTGDAVGGLLNATFGNAPELIIAFLLGGFRHRNQQFNPAAARAYSTMLLAVISLIVPSAFSRYFAPEGSIPQEQLLNLGIAVVLLFAYGLYLVFSLVTHPGAFASQEHGETGHDQHPWSLGRAIGSLLAAALLAAWMSEILVGAAEETGKALGMSQMFIGVVFLAIIGGAAESSSAIAMARRNKMDLSVGIALGSCIQIALFVAPVLVLMSYVIAPQPFDLSFNRAEVGSLFLGVLIGTLVCGDGQSNWFKGVQLTTVYVIIALMFYFIPEVVHR